ncbi:MAG: NAD+ synthase [Pseudochelatococcus sp.]|jgi:NAD+ synthase|uniref:NAD+ synthase n=1 Tax=Pseudochelatococcus sp. TaxID=2020869 RepID=UPI003D92141B
MTDVRSSLRIALAQQNPLVGDIAGNLARARAARAQAAVAGADVVLFPELFLTGYSPEDLVLKPAFTAAARAACDDLARDTADGGPAILIGLPWAEDGRIYNAVALLDGGRVADRRLKVDLPNYGVFDEKRVFDAGPPPLPLTVRGVPVGVPVCEDIWTPAPVAALAAAGAALLLVPNGSPYRQEVEAERLSIARARVAESGLPLVYLNQVGGQDEIVFDGASFALDGDGALAARLPAFAEALAVIEARRAGRGWTLAPLPPAANPQGDSADYAACVLGVRDYVTKNRFPGVVLGLSGGIDSALAAAIAVDALGRERVHAVMLPYRFTAGESLEDAALCAHRLGIRYDVLPIAPAVEGLEAALAPLFAATQRDVTEENLQSRARGTILMALSNKFGAMLLTTGNKSEMAVGYATLYGDMNGGFNPLKDLYKTQVFRLAALRNRRKPEGALGPDGEVIPERIITKVPTAELRENQTDQDSLPPYDVLDDILRGLVDAELPVEAIVAAGHDVETVRKVERLLYIAEYKRRQSAPGVKVTHRNFGRDRRYPITNGFRDPFPARPAS